jgi:NAD(P)H dehydrogenase (quinone)
MAVKVAIIYYSATGTTYQLARAIEEGARAAGAEVRFRKVQRLAGLKISSRRAGFLTPRRMGA